MSKGRFPYFIQNNELNHLRPHLNSLDFDPNFILAALSNLDQTLQEKYLPNREKFVQRKRLNSTLCPFDEERRKSEHRRAVSMQEHQLKAFENTHRAAIDQVLATQKTLIHALPKDFTFPAYEKNLLKMKEMIAARRVKLEVLKQKTGRFRLGRMRHLAREEMLKEEYTAATAKKRKDTVVSLPPVGNSFITETGYEA